MPDDSLLEQLADEFIQNLRKGKLPDIVFYHTLGAISEPECPNSFCR